MLSCFFPLILSIVDHFPSITCIDQSLIGRNSSRRGVHITLIGWRWDTIGRYLVAVTFFLLGAFAKLSYHNTHWLRTQVPESCVLILLGSFVGLILHISDIPGNTYVPQFTPEKFFYFYLPPVISSVYYYEFKIFRIILESAYELYDKTFFKNIGTIMLLAVVGTIINIIGIGISIYICSNAGLYLPFRLSFIECLTFSTLISAVDPVAVIAIFQEVHVDKALYFLVFGESLLNDAVVVTMYNTMTTFAASADIRVYHIFLAFLSFITVSGGGIIIGTLLGGFTSLITKWTGQVRVIEPLIVILCAYLSYFTAELFHFSGIISLTCCGLIQAAYARYNISSKSNITIKYFIKTLSSISEVIIFLFLGMILIRDIHTWNCIFIISTIIFCIIYRFVSIYLLTYFCNNFSNRLRNITRQEKFIMAYGGLRGAIAFALAIMLHPRDLPSADLFVTATMTVIIFTVFVQGSTTKPIVRLLGLQMLNDSDPKLFSELHLKVIETTMNGIDDIIGKSGVTSFIGKSLYHVNRSVRKFLIKDYTDRWTAVRQTMNMIEVNQLKSIFTMVKSIPDKHSASELGFVERLGNTSNTLSNSTNKFPRKGPNKKYPKAPTTISLDNNIHPSATHKSIINHNTNHQDFNYNLKHVNYPDCHSNDGSLKADSNGSSSMHHKTTDVKMVKKFNPNTKQTPNGFGPFIGYQGKVTYVKPKVYMVDQQQSKGGGGPQLSTSRSNSNEDSPESPHNNHSSKLLKTRFSSDSNISCFREALNETLGLKSYPELNHRQSNGKSSDKSTPNSKRSN